MIYNIAFCSSHTGKILELECGYDKRPLRFIDKASAERRAFEIETDFYTNNSDEEKEFFWEAIEEVND